ncbi:MAG TPA: hypothetical protein VJ831_03810 [Jatrophihabitantaceae bacterium]|nr:hypothetical protein [Jatrophihabitantaceae bacterium]
MTRYGNGPDEPMTTARIAGLSDAEAPVDSVLAHEHDALAALSDRDTETADDGSAVRTEDRSSDSAQLLGDDELETAVLRWREIQAEFVDEPRRAVQDADALVADLMQRLAAMFAHEREELEARWSSGSDIDTEDLRQGLQRYRTFFERLIAA